jgi:hypothetical protein
MVCCRGAARGDSAFGLENLISETGAVASP